MSRTRCFHATLDRKLHEMVTFMAAGGRLVMTRMIIFTVKLTNARGATPTRLCCKLGTRHRAKTTSAA
jgi:hypothetical protein